MSEHPNVTTVNQMTQAIVDQDSETLTSLFTDDFVLHLRGPFATAGDHLGVAGILGAIGAVFEATGGDVKLEQQFFEACRVRGAAEEKFANRAQTLSDRRMKLYKAWADYLGGK